VEYDAAYSMRTLQDYDTDDRTSRNEIAPTSDRHIESHRLKYRKYVFSTKSQVLAMTVISLNAVRISDTLRYEIICDNIQTV